MYIWFSDSLLILNNYTNTAKYYHILHTLQKNVIKPSNKKDSRI
jgi:hypothetical protein